MKKLLLLTFVLINFSVYAQIYIKGTVIDGLTNETLIGANVIIKETNKSLTVEILDGKHKGEVFNHQKRHS